MELLSPSVQTPGALAIFCSIHLAVSLALDITVGLVSKLQYLLLLGGLSVGQIFALGIYTRIELSYKLDHQMQVKI